MASPTCESKYNLKQPHSRPAQALSIPSVPAGAQPRFTVRNQIQVIAFSVQIVPGIRGGRSRASRADQLEACRRTLIRRPDPWPTSRAPAQAVKADVVLDGGIGHPGPGTQAPRAAGSILHNTCGFSHRSGRVLRRLGRTVMPLPGALLSTRGCHGLSSGGSS
eukprot:2492867-Rhodomonas_salina.1